MAEINNLSDCESVELDYAAVAVPDSCWNRRGQIGFWCLAATQLILALSMSPHTKPKYCLASVMCYASLIFGYCLLGTVAGRGLFRKWLITIAVFFLVSACLGAEQSASMFCTKTGISFLLATGADLLISNISLVAIVAIWCFIFGSLVKSGLDAKTTRRRLVSDRVQSASVADAANGGIIYIRKPLWNRIAGASFCLIALANLFIAIYDFLRLPMEPIENIMLVNRIAYSMMLWFFGFLSWKGYFPKMLACVALVIVSGNFINTYVLFPSTVLKSIKVHNTLEIIFAFVAMTCLSISLLLRGNKGSESGYSLNI